MLETLKKFTISAVAAAGMFGLASVADAAPISGTINIVGSVYDASAAGIKFDPNPAITSVSRAITGATGDLAVLAVPGATATVFDVDFSGPATVWSATSGGGAVFSFLATAIKSFQDFGGASIRVVALGLLSGTGFDASTGTLEFTSNGKTGNASFSSITAVPLPAGILLMGSGIAGFGLVGRLGRKSKKTLANA